MAEHALPVVDRFERIDAVPGKALVRLSGRGHLGDRAAALVMAAGERVHRYAALPGPPPPDGWRLAFAVPVAVLDSATAMAIDLGPDGAIPLRPSTSRDDREVLLAVEVRLTSTEARLAGVENALADREARLSRLGRQAARRTEDVTTIEQRLTALRSRLVERTERPPPAARDRPARQVDARIGSLARRGAAEAEALESRVRGVRERLQRRGPG